MIYTQVNSQPLATTEYEALIQQFTEKFFFDFMEYGKGGIKRVSEDFIDTIEAWYKARYPEYANTNISTADHKRTTLYIMQEIVNALITQGTGGIKSVCYSSTSYVFSMLKGSVQ